MSLIHRLFGTSTDTTVLCGRCERALEGHDDAACARKMSRRFFFGVCAGAGVAVASLPVPRPEIVEILRRDIAAACKTFQMGIYYAGGYGGGKSRAQRVLVTAAVARGDRVICPQLDGSVLTGPEWLAKHVAGKWA